jgi:hypothetical protein
VSPTSLRKLLEFLVVAVCTVTFAMTAVGIAASWLVRDAIGTRDFVEYWTSARLLVAHADPYEVTRIYAIERSLGFPANIPALVTPNPPSALLLILPLGYLSAKAAAALWLLALVLCFVLAVQMLRQMNGQPKSLLYLLAYSFAPALSCLLSGQITLFLLFGLVLFLRFHATHPVRAGAALWFCLLKPHLFLLFGLVLLVWIITTRAYKVVLGTAAALALSTGIVLLYDHAAWAHYRQMMVRARIDRITIPCFSMLLREHLPPHTLAVQCLPAALGCAWALAYYYRHRADWNWLEHGSLLVLVSVLLAPYTWFMDQCVVIPALLYAGYRTQSRALIALLALGSALIEIEILRGVPLLHGAIYAWAPPAWLLWYLLARRWSSTDPDAAAPVQAMASAGTASAIT